MVTPNIPPDPEPTRVVARPARRLRRIALWTLAFVLGMLATLVIGVAALLRSPRFHDYALTKARQSASEALGVPVDLQNYALHFAGFSPTVDLYGLVIHGAAPYANSPLLQAAQVRVGVRVISLLGRKWYLSEVALHRPVLQIRVDADGHNNLPKFPGSRTRSTGLQPIFDLAIRLVSLDNGEIYYNDQQSSLDAEARELMLNAGFDTARQAYAGQMAYSAGSIKAERLNPIPHALSANFEITPAHLDLRQAVLRTGDSAITFDGAVDDFSNPRAAITYHASLNVADLRPYLRGEELPLGSVLLEGRAEYVPKPDTSLLNCVTVSGVLRSDRLEFRLQAAGLRSARVEVRAIRAAYSLANGDGEVHSLTAFLLGGSIAGGAKVRSMAANQTGFVHIKVDRISLAGLRQLVGIGSASEVTLAGTLQGTGDATWKGSLQNLQATADATIDAEAGSRQTASTIPVMGEIHAGFLPPGQQSTGQQLTLRQTVFRTPQTTLMLDGSIGQRSKMNLSLRTANLHEIESIAEMFITPSRRLGLYGSAKFEGMLSGPTVAPSVSGDLSGVNLQVRGTEWKLLRAHLNVSPGSVNVQGGQLEPAVFSASTQGSITFSGRAALKHWEFTQSSPFDVKLGAQRLDAGQLARLAGFTAAVTGTLTADVQAHGTELNPIGQGRMEIEHASLSGEPIQSARLEFTGDGSAAHTNLSVTMSAGVTSAVLTYHPRQRGYEVHAEARNFKLDQLHVVKSHNLSVAGAMNFVASGRGTLDDPQLSASLEIPKLRMKDQTVENLALQAEIAQHLAKLTLDTRALNSNVHGRATVQLSGDYSSDVVLDTQTVPLQPLVALYAPSLAADLSGQTELHATLRGPLKHREQIEAHVVIPEMDIHYRQSIALAASAPIRADYKEGVLNVQRSGLKGTGTDIEFQGSLPLLDRAKPVSVLLLGSVDMRLAQLFDPDVKSSGVLRFNINTYGSRSGPNFRGDVRIENANVALADEPVGLSNGNGTLALTGDRLDITSFEGTMGGGKVTAGGGIVYHPSMQFDVALAGQGIRVLSPDGVREDVSANLTLTGTPERAALRGQVNVDQLSLTSDFDLSSLSSFGGGGVEEPPSRGFAGNLRLDIALRSSHDIDLVSRTVSANGAANLRVTGTAAEPVILGRISLTGGDLIFRGNRYVLESGVISFVNPTRTEPNVNASLTTTIQQYNISLRLEGPLERLRTSYSSDPALPPADIINLIVLGTTQEGSAANQVAGTTPSLTAEQSIASAVAGQVTSRAEKIVGISSLSIDPTLGNNQQSADATVTVQQRVTSKIFVTFSADVTSTQQQVIQLQYQATPRVSVSGTRDQNGGFGFDTRIRREW